MLGTLAWAKALLRRAHHMRGGLKRFLRVTWQRAISHEQEALRVQGEIAERLLVYDLGHPGCHVLPVEVPCLLRLPPGADLAVLERGLIDLQPGTAAGVVRVSK